MVSDCDEPASIRESTPKTGPPATRGLADEITQIEESLYRVFSSLVALAQEQHLPAVCRSLSRLKQDTSESLLSGYSSIFCSSFPATARQILSEFRFLLDLKARTTRLSVEELQTQSAELEKYLAFVEWEFQDAQVVFKKEAARLAGVYAMRVSQFVEATSGQLSDEIREQFRLLEETDRSERSDRMNAFVQARLRDLLGRWQSPFEESSIELFQHAAIRFAKHASELIASLRSNVRSLSGLSTQTTEWREDCEESECLAYICDRGPDCFFKDIQPYFPQAHFRKHLLRNTLRNANSDLLSYASRAVESHKNHLDKCCTDLLRHITQQLSEASEGIRSVVEMFLCKAKRQDKLVSPEDEPDGVRHAVDLLHRYGEELDLLLYRWESVADTAREGCVNAKEPETGR